MGRRTRSASSRLESRVNHGKCTLKTQLHLCNFKSLLRDLSFTNKGKPFQAKDNLSLNVKFTRLDNITSASSGTGSLIS